MLSAVHLRSKPDLESLYELLETAYSSSWIPYFAGHPSEVEFIKRWKFSQPGAYQPSRRWLRV